MSFYFLLSLQGIHVVVVVGLSSHNRVVKLRIPSPLNDPFVAAESHYLGIALSSVFGSILETWPYRTTRHSHLNQNQKPSRHPVTGCDLRTVEKSSLRNQLKK